MFVSSTSSLVPCVTVARNHDIRFHIYSTTDNKFVEYIGDMYYQKGELLKDNDAPTPSPIFLTDGENVRQAAKELLRSRPEPFGDDVAAVMLRNRDTTGIIWYRVNNKGMLKLFSNAEPINITDKTEGDVYDGTSAEIYFSPISAINAVKNYLENVCNDIIREAAEREAKESQDIRLAKSFIDKIKKAQEI